VIGAGEEEKKCEEEEIIFHVFVLFATRRPRPPRRHPWRNASQNRVILGALLRGSHEFFCYILIVTPHLLRGPSNQWCRDQNQLRTCDEMDPATSAG
jgi:hypothetical protein